MYIFQIVERLGDISKEKEVYAMQCFNKRKFFAARFKTEGRSQRGGEVVGLTGLTGKPNDLIMFFGLLFMMKKYIYLLGFVLSVRIMAVAADAPIYKHEDEDLGISYPETLAGMEFVQVCEYEDPRLGYSVRYQGQNLIKADIYVYDYGLMGIPNGCDNKPVKSESVSIGQAIKAMVKEDKYTRVQNVCTGFKPQKGPIRFIWNKYQFSHVIEKDDDGDYGGVRLSEGLITGFNGKFVKIRLTYRKENSRIGTKTSNDVVNEVVDLLKPADEAGISFVIEGDGSLSDKLAASWLCYLMGRLTYVTAHEDQYNLLPGYNVPKFEEEVEGRNKLAQIWKELKAKEDYLNDKYLDELELVLDAGFMREYVWVYLKRLSWKRPTGLKTNSFQNWAKKKLKDHEVETYGNLRVTLKSDEPGNSSD
ncbi:hypothetical protein ACFLS1_02640 [Verrucomicrobiota bacterium]